jgi:dipeptidyl aminopeptidase/acylaminoacyl peptidase
MIVFASKKARQWGVRNGQVALFGYSAGGHLALLYSYARNWHQTIGSVISLAGLTDVQDSVLMENQVLYEEIKLMAGNPSPATWTPANPIHFAGEPNPPTMLIHGTSDQIVPVSQAYKLNQALERSNIKVKMLILENEPHHDFSSGAVTQFLVEAKYFLAANLN